VIGILVVAGALILMPLRRRYQKRQAQAAEG